MKTPENNGIIWLASYPKSGNTWFRIFLNNLLSDSELPVDINKLDSSIISSNRVLFDRHLGINTSDLTFKEIDVYRPDVYRKLAKNTDDIAFVKTHDAWQANEQGESIFPGDVTKGVLYFIRNPLDIAVSFAHHGDISISNSIHNLNRSDFGLCIKPDRLYNQIHQALNDWSHHVISWTRSSGLPIHIVRFEDLVNNTFQEFINCLDFIGLDYDPSDVNRAISHSSFLSLQQQEKSHGFREKESKAKSFFRKGIVNDWKSNLTQADVDEIVGKHENIMREFGYLEEII